MGVRAPLAEVLPSPWLQDRPGALTTDQQNLFASPDFSNLRDAHSGDSIRHALVFRSREQKLVLIPAMERVAEFYILLSFSNPGEWHCRSENLGPNAGFFADVSQVRGEPVADVNHRRGKPLGPQQPAHRNARHRMKVPWKVPRTQHVPGEKFLQGGRSSPEFACDIDQVPWPSSRPQDGLPLRHGAEHDNIGENPCRRFGSVSPRQSYVELVSKPEESSEESVDPAL